MYKNIAFDMDGVIFDFASSYAKKYSELHPDDALSEADILSDWNVGNVTKYSEKLWKNKGFFADLQPYPGMAELFRWCYANYETYVISAAPANVLGEKAEAMMSICPSFNDWDIFFCNRKEMISVDVLVDDGPHNIKACSDHCVVFDRPYNRGVEGIARLNNAEDLRAWIEANLIPRAEKYLQA